MEPTGIKVAHQTIEKVCALDQYLEPFFEILIFFVGDKRKVSAHFYSPLLNPRLFD
jgi:hypothetical protein